ncbi:MAG: hypothetical protein M1827_003185 [Pycnora praestabilis]|nr:MAG: hypothetical protein M1827_003185 [Pycnora praestabilis]
MANHDISGDGLIDFPFDPRGVRYSYVPRASWPLPMEQTMSQTSSDGRRPTTPLQTAGHAFNPAAYPPTLLTEWQIQQAAQLQYPPNPPSLGSDFTGGFSAPFHTSPVDLLSSGPVSMDASLQIDGSLNQLAGQMNTMPFDWQEFQHDMGNLIGFAGTDGLPNMSLTQRSLADSSPTDTYLEVRSNPSSSSDNGWTTVDYRQPLYSSHAEGQAGAVWNPSQTLHIRTHSDSSHSDAELSRNSFGSLGSFEEVSYPLSSPESDSHFELGYHPHDLAHQHFAVVSPSAVVDPVPIKKSPSERSSPISPCVSSPTGRKASRKSPIAKATKPVIRRPSQTIKKDIEKRVGKRKGPLRPDQRKQASEIRKLRACLRCKFLKKTCDKGEPCTGCQPSHARLWQVPCTRIDIKDIAYFMKDYKADFERHVTLGFSIENIKGFSQSERTIYITHGYGHFLRVEAREVFVRDEGCFATDWTESIHETPREFETATAKLSAGVEGISDTLLSLYLDAHIDGDFPRFVDEHFEGTPFLTQILKTAHQYYLRAKLPVIRKALKLVVAYNLTMHVTLVEGPGSEDCATGEINNEDSKFNGKTIAPTMINFQVKRALADMWRELQKDILNELSSLYSSVYSGDKLKNWPTIFMLATILLAVWEEMQFDCHYRVPDPAVVNKFCNDMETTPVGVIVGLFSAISQKLPAFSDWDTRKHHHLLNSDMAVCDALTEVREHVTQHETYLKGRVDAEYDRKNFDSLSNKFLAKLVIRAN